MDESSLLLPPEQNYNNAGGESDNAVFYDNFDGSVKISKALPFEIEFETEELEQQHKYGMQVESASIVSSAGPEIMVSIGLVLFIAALASFGYYYLNKRRQFQHGQPLSTPSDSSIDVEKLEHQIDTEQQQQIQQENGNMDKINLDRRFDNLW